MRKIAILHTAKATVPMLNKLINQNFQEVVIFDWLDDSILPMLMEDSSTLEYAFEKLLSYSRFAERQGAELILNACSSVGEFKDYAKGRLSIPVLRIDDMVTDVLADKYHKIGVLATLGTTLRPSTELLKKKAKNMDISAEIVSGAYEAALSGKQQEHDNLIAAAVMRILREKEAVFLAQASMAAALHLVPEEFHGRVYTSTEYVMNELKQYL